MCYQLSNTEELIDMFWRRRRRQKHSIVQKTMSKSLFVSMLGRYDCAVLLFSLHFVLTSIHPLAWLSALCMPVQHSRGPPGRTNPHRRVWSCPTIPSPTPFPSPILSVSSCPTVSLPICPASLPCDLVADKTRGPAVPSAWCQHFPLIQSQSCCVTDERGDQKQQPS